MQGFSWPKNLLLPSGLSWWLLPLSRPQSKLSFPWVNCQFLFLPKLLSSFFFVCLFGFFFCFVFSASPGYPLSVTAILEERLIRSIHFLRSSAAASNETPCPYTDPACPTVQLLVLCTDSSFYLVKAPGAGKSSITLLADR